MKILMMLCWVVAGAPLISYADPHFGGQLGVNMTKLRRPAGEPTTLDRSFRVGFTIGGWLDLRYWEPVFPRFELSFTRRGTDIDENGSNLGALELDYIDLSTLARVEKTVNNVVVFGNVGPQLNLLIGARQFDVNGTRDAKDAFVSIDIGFAAAVGVATKPTRWGTFSLSGRYDMGFLDTSDSGSSELKNICVSILLGYEYRRARRRATNSGGGDNMDDTDRCRRQPEDTNGFADDDGCTDARSIHDADGVPEPDDQCPASAEDRNSVEDRCRDQFEDRDSVKGSDGHPES
ncbi:MAG: PorT family protein [Proteobacteria bacterium]|nr:PorT family protein [Pseudomonadota bacterium]